MEKRIFASVTNKKCPYGCIYCFVNSTQYKRGIDIKNKKKFSELIERCSIIQPACDSELLLEKKWFELLVELAQYGKSISFASKKCISNDEVKRLKIIDDILKEKEEILNVGVTICRYNGYQEIEPNAPHPDKRIEGLRRLYDSGIGCNVIIRPIFPDGNLDDFYQIIDKTNKYCYGYLLGPLYANENVKNYFKTHEIWDKDLVSEIKTPEWNQYSEMEVMYSFKIMKQLENYIINKSSRIFYSNDLCVEEIRRMRRIRK